MYYTNYSHLCPHHTAFVLSMKCSFCNAALKNHARFTEIRALPNATGGTALQEGKWVLVPFLAKRTKGREDNLWYFCCSQSQGHWYDCPKVSLTTEEDRDAGFVSSLRSSVFAADSLKRTAPQAAEMGQALVMEHHTVKKSTQRGESLISFKKKVLLFFFLVIQKCN